MKYRLIAAVAAFAAGLSSAAMASMSCPVGQVYFRSKHTCVSKAAAIHQGIYHRPIAAKAKRAPMARQPAGAHIAGTRAIPLPPVRLARNTTLSALARSDAAGNSGRAAATAPSSASPAGSPYGALVPVEAVE
jgi:hypothetical protein